LETPPIHILIVEDNLAHQKITEYVLKHNNIKATLRIVRDGQEAVDYIFRKHHYANDAEFPIPDLILLDLNLPKRDGREVLKIIKDDPLVSDIPVVIVSTSDRVEDVTYAMETGAVAYVSKSSGFDKFNEELTSALAHAKKK
jgi:CheY-like chemotaxis protein